MKRLFSCAAVLAATVGLLVATVSTASASTVRQLTLKELATQSTTIVHATVSGVSSRWDDQHKEIYTYFDLQVLEHIKGQKGKSVLAMRQLGGAVEGIASVVPGMPSFHTGDEVVVFLTEPDRAGYPWVVGLQQGKYDVVTDGAGAKTVRSEAALHGLPSPESSLRSKDGRTDLSLKSFLDQVRKDLGASQSGSAHNGPVE